jgi:polysaccharide pyruvyl transferase WcaK-like protein
MNIWVVNRNKTNNLGDRLIGESLRQALETHNTVVQNEFVGVWPWISRLGYVATIASVVLSIFRKESIRRPPDLIIVGGGQLLLPTPRFLGAFSGWALLAYLYGVPLIAFSVGTEGRVSGVKRWIMTLNLAGCLRVKLRDEYSRALLISAGMRSYEIVPDVVYLSEKIKDLGAVSKNGIYICLADYNGSVLKYSPEISKADYHELAVEKAKLEVTPNEPIVLFSSSESDYEELEQFKQLCLSRFSEQCINVWRPNNVMELIEGIGRARVIISARMHPLIVGQIAGGRIVALERNKKLANYSGSARLKTAACLSLQVQDALNECIASAEGVSKLGLQYL